MKFKASEKVRKNSNIISSRKCGGSYLHEKIKCVLAELTGSKEISEDADALLAYVKRVGRA